MRHDQMRRESGIARKKNIAAVAERKQATCQEVSDAALMAAPPVENSNAAASSRRRYFMRRIRRIHHNGGDLMHEYDTAFKLTLQHVDVTFRELLGTAIARWHNVEFPQIRSTRADLLGETAAGDLVHIE